jgi:hypothetical protein
VTILWGSSPTTATAPRLELSAALLWLGHRCPGDCTDVLDQLTADVWFIRRTEGRGVKAPSYLVAIDFSDPSRSPGQTSRLIRRLNRCIRADRLQVRERRSGDQGRALSVTTEAVSTEALLGRRSCVVSDVMSITMGDEAVS